MFPVEDRVRPFVPDREIGVSGLPPGGQRTFVIDIEMPDGQQPVHNVQFGLRTYRHAVRRFERFGLRQESGGGVGMRGRFVPVVFGRLFGNALLCGKESPLIPRMAGGVNLVIFDELPHQAAVVHFPQETAEFGRIGDRLPEFRLVLYVIVNVRSPRRFFLLPELEILRDAAFQFQKQTGFGW